ncbi:MULTISPECIES: PAS domain S-box protein [Salinibaculum]|uniref:PAS domain S-box protein n=1 Tax=Salinibaculum TaxID=2732368 RepID=UPI0030CE538D
MAESIRVLHVEADGDAATRTARALQEVYDRFSVVTRESARAGLAYLDEHPVDCILSGYHLPDRDGLAFLDAVREVRPDLPFVLFTDDGSEAVASDAISAGATEYFSRDGSAEQYDLLANRIVTVVESYRAIERTARLERIRTLVRDVNQALVRATTRDEIESRVCDILAGADPYQFVWIGEVDPETERLEPTTWAGSERGYLDDVTVTTDDGPTGWGPAGSALRECDVAITQNIQEDPAFEPWREAALERGYQSVAAVPLVYQDTRYGVLNVYAARPHAFDDDERALLAEVGDDIAHAFHAVEVRDQLAHERERFRRLVDEVEEYAIFRLDTDGTVVSWNEGARRLGGYTSDEILGEHVSTFYPPDAEPDAATTLAVAAEEGSCEKEGWRVRKDGSRFWGAVTVTALHDDGTLRGFTVITRDMTEQRDRERVLRRFERAVESAGQGVYITDADGEIEYVNPAFEEITGYSREEAVGKTPRILKSGEMPEEYYEQLWATLLDGEPWEAEITDRRADGELYYAHQTIAPILDDEGEPQEFVAIQTDVTERKEREEDLRVMTRAITEAPIGFVITDPDREDNPIVHANDRFQELTGYDESEIVGRNCRFLQGEGTDAEAVAAMREAVDREEPVSVTLRNYRKDGSEFWNRVTIAPVTDETGSVTNYVGFQQDVTERREREQQLQVLDRVLRHNLNNDLNVIRGRAETIESAAPPEIADEATHIVAKTSELSALVDKERAITKVLSENFQRRPLDVSALVEGTATSTSTDYPDAAVDVDVPDGVTALATSQFSRALDELVENAIVHNDADRPEVSVSVTRDGDTVAIDVADNGPGIPEMERNVLLGEEELEPLYHGSGLGLWLVYWIIRQSGGTLSFTDGDPTGSVVTIELQAAPGVDADGTTE